MPRDGYVPTPQTTPAPATPSPPPPPDPAPPSMVPRVTTAPNNPVVISQPLPTLPLPTPPPTGSCRHAVARTRPYQPADLGSGFPSAPAGKETLARRLHDWFAGRFPRTFDFAAHETLKGVSGITERSVGIDVDGLLDVERTMYRMMVPSRDGYVGGAPPIFQALAQGQAAYVYLKEDPYNGDHLTRLFSGLPPETLTAMGPGNDRLTPVRQALLDRLQKGDFPAYIDVDGKYDDQTGTESIATESIASIARRENGLSTFSDPTNYYRWLVTRVDSAFRRTDPWLYSVKPDLHNQIDDVKDSLTPPWLESPTEDPLGSVPLRKNAQKAYHDVMGTAGGGKPPTMGTLSDFADTAISLDRDLLFSVQTYWAKLLREVAPAQRESLFAPLAKTWVTLNTLQPDDPNFDMVSPPDAPYIELIDGKTGNFLMERYDRATALAEVVNHSLDGLGIAERRHLLDTVNAEIQARRTDVEDREQRVRGLLGTAYQGLDVDGILSGRVDARDPDVQKGLDQLRQALDQGGVIHPMTPAHAEIQRHLSLLGFVARRPVKYAEPVLELARKLPPQTKDPLIVGQYWQPVDGAAPSPLPPGPSRVEVLGQPRPGHPPLPLNVVLEGGGGKGFAYVECLKQLKGALRAGNGQVAIDGYVGTSAGAITAGMLAAGYSETEMATILQQLDFKKFYADYLWLAGGVDPEVRGVDRTGLFTTRQMYDSLSALIARKVSVQGRPVLFRDLPFKLKVVSTVLNGDLPDELKQQLNVGKDGQIVFSNEATPNMDVAAAICASAAVPGFFNAPQVQMARTEPNGQLAEYRLQLVDGGTVNNFPIAEAAGAKRAKACLVVPPAYYQAPGVNPGDPPVSLSTLNFDPANLKVIDAFNRQRYQQFAPHLAALLQKAQDGGSPRAVIAFNLATPDDQPNCIVQGTTRKASQALYGLAGQVGLVVDDPKTGAARIRGNFPAKASFVEQVALDDLLDKDHTLKPSMCGEPQYHPPRIEAVNVGDVLIGAAAAQMVAPHHLETKLFERG